MNCTPVRRQAPGQDQEALAAGRDSRGRGCQNILSVKLLFKLLEMQFLQPWQLFSGEGVLLPGAPRGVALPRLPRNCVSRVATIRPAFRYHLTLEIN